MAPSPSLSSDKRNVFARRKLRRTVGPLPAANARSPRRKEKTEIARIEETANESGTEIVTVAVTIAIRRGKGTGIVSGIVIVSERETETTTAEEGSTIDEMITTTAIGPQRTTGTGNMDIDLRNTTRTTTGTIGRGTASIGTRTVKRRAGARGNGPPRKNVMKEVRRQELSPPLLVSSIAYIP